jgi:cyanophycin synthetase
MNVTVQHPEKSDETGMMNNLTSPSAISDGILSTEVKVKMEKISMSSHLSLREAESRGWKTTILNHEKNLIALVTSNSDRSIVLRGATSELNTALGKLLADDKILTYTIANYAGIPTPASLLLTPDRDGSDVELQAFLRAHGHIVVKPIDCSCGKGVTTTVTDQASLHVAIEYAKQFSKNIMVQRYANGDDYRILVLNGRVIAAVRRCPTSIIGDGVKTIQQLFEIENAQPLRGSSRFKPLRSINPDEVKAYIGIERMNSVPAPGQKVQLVGVANCARVSICCDVTEFIHPSIYRLAEKMTDAAYLSLCGVDIIIDGDASQPIGSGCQAVLIEINTAPDLSLHHFPTGGGHARNVTAAILNEIFRCQAVGRKIFTERTMSTSTNSNLANQTDDGEHFAEIIANPETFFHLSVAESDFYAKDVLHR